MKTERIILSVEIVDDGLDARASLRVPYEITSVIYGTWMDLAVRDLRDECNFILKAKRTDQS